MEASSKKDQCAKGGKQPRRRHTFTPEQCSATPHKPWGDWDSEIESLMASLIQFSNTIRYAHHDPAYRNRDAFWDGMATEIARQGRRLRTLVREQVNK